MSAAYRNFFGFSREPFSSDLEIENIIQTPEIKAAYDRFEYTVKLGAIALVTGEIGAGKSTALRWIVAQLHPSCYRPIWITASSGSILEVYRQILAEFEVKTATSSRATLTGMIRKQISELAQNRKLQPVLIIDEASLLRLEVFAELHTISQFAGDSKPWLPIILIGQNNLADNLLHRTATPLASRIVARSHLESVNREKMDAYLIHHLSIAGLKNSPFEEAATTAIFQGSGGIFRKANHLARGALIAAASERSQTVNVEHVRSAVSEVF
jgi:type II secretory pathway predicted ATPase ExeA